LSGYRLLFVPLLTLATLKGQEPVFKREALIQDTRYLGRILEQAHPDPYTAFGGRIAFHRELQMVMRALPSEGMTARAFHGHLATFVARMKDSHTTVRLPKEMEALQEPGLPLAFRAVGDSLVIAQAEDASMLGARLLAIQDQGFASLRNRVSQFHGIENESGELLFLMEGFQKAAFLKRLLPEWTGGNTVEVQLALTNGLSKKVTLELGACPSAAPKLPTRVTALPNTASTSIAWTFLDPKGETACLTLADSMGYRENIELYLSYKQPLTRTMVEDMFRKQQGRSPRNDVDLVSAFPSALETFTNLAQAMKAKGTKTLLVDVRENSGGNSLFGKLLVYVMHGPDGLRRTMGGFSIPRISQLLLDNRSPSFLTTFNAERDFPLELDEYSFETERATSRTNGEAPSPFSNWREFPSLAKELDDPKSSSIYRPSKVFVLCSPRTFSAGFDVALALHHTGAKLVGVPSGQAANCFIDLLRYKLPASGLVGGISYKAVYNLPHDPEKGRLFPCELPLTMDLFKDYEFDANVEVLMALDAAKSSKLGKP